MINIICYLIARSFELNIQNTKFTEHESSIHFVLVIWLRRRHTRDPRRRTPCHPLVVSWGQWYKRHCVITSFARTHYDSIFQRGGKREPTAMSPVINNFSLRCIYYNWYLQKKRKPKVKVEEMGGFDAMHYFQLWIGSAKPITLTFLDWFLSSYGKDGTCLHWLRSIERTFQLWEDA